MGKYCVEVMTGLSIMKCRVGLLNENYYNNPSPFLYSDTVFPIWKLDLDCDGQWKLHAALLLLAAHKLLLMF